MATTAVAGAGAAPAVGPAPARSRRRSRRGRAVTPYLFVAPASIAFLLFVIGPLIAAIYLSLTRYDVLTPPEFVGLRNYSRMLADPRLLRCYANTAVYVACAVVLMNVLALALAVLLNQRMPAPVKYVLRSAFFFPSLVGLVYVATIWQALLQRDTGVVNYYLTQAGGPRLDWLNGPHLSLASVVLVDVWRNVGFGMLILLAALQDVPRELVESAEVEGAGRMRVLWHVILPSVSPALFFNVTMTVIGAFQIYESVVVLTNGGPGDNTRSVVMYIAEVALQKYQMGYACAIAVSLFAVITVLTLLQFRLRRLWVHADG